MKLSGKLIPAAIGVCVGAGGAWLAPTRKSRYSILLGGVVGASLGSLAWQSRHQTTAMARNAIRKVNDRRDARWLARHPIAYA